MTNSLIAIRKFITGEDDSTIKEIYQIAMINQAQILAQSTSPLPLSITPQELQVFMIKALLSDALRFDAMAKIKLTELAMNEAVIGNNPRIDLVLEPNPSNPNSLRLKSPSEAEIIQSVQSQFADDALTLACIIHESRVKNPETTTRYKLQRLDLNNSLFCLSVTGLSGEKIMVKKAEKRGQKTL